MHQVHQKGRRGLRGVILVDQLSAITCMLACQKKEITDYIQNVYNKNTDVKKNQETAVTLKSSKMTDSLLRLYHIFFQPCTTIISWCCEIIQEHQK